MVGSSLALLEIPVGEVVEASGVAVEKEELSALLVQIGVDIVVLTDCGEPSVIEEPDDMGRLREGGQSHLIAGA